MLNNLLPLLVVLLIAWIWLNGARAREFATVLVRRYCDNRGLQLLDETVSLARMGIRQTDHGMRLRRMYRFEFSLEGLGRRTGYLLMLGTQLEAIDDGLPRPSKNQEPPPPAKTPAPSKADDKVVPFRRRR